MTNPHDEHHAGEPASEEALLERLTTGQARAADWTTLRHQVNSNPDLWQELVSTQEFESQLRHAVDSEATRASTIELVEAASSAPSTSWNGLTARSGWAAALILGLGWFLQVVLQAPPAREPGNVAVRAPEASAPTVDQHFAAYLKAGQQSGQVLGTLPPVVVGTTPDDDSGDVELLVVRRVLERGPVPDTSTIEQDELGRWSSVKPTPAFDPTRESM